jgi:aminomethyltransferase
MGYSLNGLDFDSSNTPLEIDAESLVDFNKEFIGKEALLRQRKEGPKKKLAGLVFTGDKPAPAGAVITAPHGEGKLTSCLRCPVVGKTLGLGYVPAQDFVPGASVSIKTTGGEWTACVTAVPFYKNGTFKKCLE